MNACRSNLFRMKKKDGLRSKVVSTVFIEYLVYLPSVKTKAGVSYIIGK